MWMKNSIKQKERAAILLDYCCPLYLGSLSIVGVGFVKIPPQFYEKGPFYVQFQVLLILGMLNKPPHYRPFYPMMYSEVSGFGTV